MLRFDLVPLNKVDAVPSLRSRIALHAVPRVDEMIRIASSEGTPSLFKVIAVAHHCQMGADDETAATLFVVRSEDGTLSFEVDSL
jgi:hypothetical protein